MIDSDPNASIPAAANPADIELRRLMSRLIDGDCDGHVAPAACERWLLDASARAHWHEYSLVGDLIRSPDLHSPPTGDAGFLAQLRERLAAEPAIVAPLPAPAAPAARPTRDSRVWAIPSAIAAGFAVVAVVLLVNRPTTTPDVAAQQIAATTIAADALMIRDARLDLYMQAHHGMRANGAAAMPGGALRNVDMLVPQR